MNIKHSELGSSFSIPFTGKSPFDWEALISVFLSHCRLWPGHPLTSSTTMSITWSRRLSSLVTCLTWSSRDNLLLKGCLVHRCVHRKFSTTTDDDVKICGSPSQHHKFTTPGPHCSRAGETGSWIKLKEVRMCFGSFTWNDNLWAGQICSVSTA